MNDRDKLVTDCCAAELNASLIVKAWSGSIIQIIHEQMSCHGVNDYVCDNNINNIIDFNNGITDYGFSCIRCTIKFKNYSPCMIVCKFDYTNELYNTYYSINHTIVDDPDCIAYSEFISALAHATQAIGIYMKSDETKSYLNDLRTYYNAKKAITMLDYANKEKTLADIASSLTTGAKIVTNKDILTVVHATQYYVKFNDCDREELALLLKNPRISSRKRLERVVLANIIYNRGWNVRNN